MQSLNNNNYNYPERKYDVQIHLNLGRGVTAVGLMRKAMSHCIPAETVDLRQKNDVTPLFRLTHKSRLYIIGHGMTFPGGEHGCISNDGRGFTWKQIAQAIAETAPHLLVPDPSGRKLRISLVVCDAGIGKKLSPAAELIAELYRLNINAEVIARLGVVESRVDEGGTFHKLVNGVHTRGTKILLACDGFGIKAKVI